jgi:hypothetical protein
MSLTINTLRLNLFKELNEFMSEKGFVFLAERDSFILEAGGIRKKIYIEISTYSDRIVVGFQLRVRDIVIESLKNKVKEKVLSDPDTVMTNYYLLAKKYNLNDPIYNKQRHIVKNSDDLKSILLGFTTFMDIVGFIFFNQFENIRDFDRWFNEPVLNGEYNFQTGQNWNDSLGGLISAKLSNNPKYEDIFAVWMQKMEEKGNETKVIRELQATKHYLDNVFIKPEA